MSDTISYQRDASWIWDGTLQPIGIRRAEIKNHDNTKPTDVLKLCRIYTHP